MMTHHDKDLDPHWFKCHQTPSLCLTQCRLIISGVLCHHYSDVIMTAMATQITILTTVYSTVYSGADQRKHQSSASLVFVRGIHRWPVNSPHKVPVARKMFPFDDVIMIHLRVIIKENVYSSYEPRLWATNELSMQSKFPSNIYSHPCLTQYISWLISITKLVIVVTFWVRHRAAIRRTLIQHLRHDDVIKGKYFPRYWPFVRGIHWIFLWSASKQTAEQTLETPVIWGAVVLIITSL